MASLMSSYVAIRAVASGDAWWAAARRRRDIPPPVVSLLHGRTRIELSSEEADAVLQWAASVDGWANAQPKPLAVHHAGA